MTIITRIADVPVRSRTRYRVAHRSSGQLVDWALVAWANVRDSGLGNSRSVRIAAGVAARSFQVLSARLHHRFG